MAVLLPFIALAQNSITISGVTTMELNHSNPKYRVNEPIELIINKDGTYKTIYDGKDTKFRSAQLSQIIFDKPEIPEHAWMLSKLMAGTYESIETKGMQYSLRNEIDQDCIDAYFLYEKYNSFFNDDYVTDYLQSLLYEIHPITLNDGRPGNLNIRVLKNASPNALCAPNGMIFITTGLLSLIDTEEELIGILAHEVAHFVLDHQVQNINTAMQRQKRAEFWAGMATAAAAIGEVYLAVDHDYVPTGNLTYSVAVLSSVIGMDIVERLGAKYTKAQEEQADEAAILLLRTIRIQPSAYASAFTKIGDYAILTGNYNYIYGGDSHPELMKRILNAGGTGGKIFSSTKYHQTMSLVNTFSAILEYNSRHMKACEELASKNINAGVATEEDYMLKAMVVRALSNTQESNEAALGYLKKAKSLNIFDYPYLSKQEGITLLRLGMKEEAQKSFQTYAESLEAIEEPDGYVNMELKWTKKMIYKSMSL